MRRLGLAFVATGLSACAGPRVLPASSLDNGLLIARVEARGALIRGFSSKADTAMIHVLDAAGLPLEGESVVSALALNGYVVFLDMPARRYILTRASFRARGVRYQLIVPPGYEAKRTVALRAGSAAYLGDYIFDSDWPEFTVALGRALRIVGHWLTPFLKRPMLPRDANFRPYENGPVAETKALLAVRDALSGTPWRRVVDARLRELSAAEAPKVAGVLRSRPLPLQEEPFLSWRDTLKWGAPRRAPAGLAWRRPGGETQIAVFYTTASAPGFSGWAGAVSELRRSASTSVEDRGGVYEVRVATRTGLAARTTKHRYAKGMLVGSDTSVLLTETILIPDGYGFYTMRLRAPQNEFDSHLPAYREFLLQLVLGPPQTKRGPDQEPVLPSGGPP